MNAPRPQHILQLSGEQKRRFLDSFERVFSDIDGVVWNLHHEISGAPEAFNALRKAGKPITFVTNNSVRPMDKCLRRFEKVGLPEVRAEDVWHPAQTTVQYLRKIKFEGLIYIIASENFKKELRQAGFQLLDGPNNLIEESFESLAAHIFDRQPVRAVIIDVDFNLSSPKVLRAHLYLRRPDCLYFCGATDRLLPVAKDIQIIGPGPFTDIVTEASGRQPITMGKPGRELGDLLLQHFEVSIPSRVLMIGDMLAQDIRFGRLCGLQTLLVLSGGCSLEQLQAETSAEQLPDYYADGMGDFLEFFESLKKAHV